jgi:hypothetical protein
MPWGDSILVKLFSVQKFPVPEWAKLSRDLGNFSVIILLNKIKRGLHLFSFFSAYYYQIWSFDGVTKFLHIPFTALELFD